MILDKEGIENVRKACEITSEILNNLIVQLKKGAFLTEKDIEKWLRKEAYSKKCKLAFKPVIAMQENAAEMHHHATNSKLKNGFLVIDFGVKYGGYCADCTRTVYLGKPSKKEIKLYNLILMAQKTGLQETKIGVYAADIDLIVRAALQDYLWNFVHGTGHGVGKKIHMAPKISPRSKSIIRKNQAITIEPGLYFKNKLGIRIEDTILVKEKSLVLTKITKKLISIKR